MARPLVLSLIWLEWYTTLKCLKDVCCKLGSNTDLTSNSRFGKICIPFSWTSTQTIGQTCLGVKICSMCSATSAATTVSVAYHKQPGGKALHLGKFQIQSEMSYILLNTKKASSESKIKIHSLLFFITSAPNINSTTRANPLQWHSIICTTIKSCIHIFCQPPPWCVCVCVDRWICI